MKLREIRRQKDLTQKQVADAAGITFSLVSRYEKGSIVPPLHRMKDLASVLGVTLEELCSDEPYVEPGEEETPILQEEYVVPAEEDHSCDQVEGKQFAVTYEYKKSPSKEINTLLHQGYRILLAERFDDGLLIVYKR